jgi:cysteinyl-tRNA synthetase
LIIFNTLSQTKETVQARDGHTFKMFVCGPTVQDNIHLGHAKTYIAFDVLARWLLKSRHKIFFIMNITDVDDKIFERAKRENVPYTQIANRFYNEFLKDIEELNIVTISKIERVSNYVKEATDLIQTMISEGKAYSLEGSYYFDTLKADNFGKLSHQSNFQLRLKQIDAAPGKRNSVDFLLWRKATEAGEGVWECSLGPGRPGWHIEDSAIVFSQFGGPYDLHGGATELIFPHHEAELAQDEAVSGEIPFVSIWMHTGLLLKDGEKMSKSLGNMITIKEALKSHSPDTIRYYVLSHHYRDSYDVDLEKLKEAGKSLEIVLNTAKILPKGSKKEEEPESASGKKLLREFSESMDDDLDTPNALRMLTKLAQEIGERSRTGQEPLEDSFYLFWYMVETLGFGLL